MPVGIPLGQPNIRQKKLPYIINQTQILNQLTQQHEYNEITGRDLKLHLTIQTDHCYFIHIDLSLSLGEPNGNENC